MSPGNFQALFLQLPISYVFNCDEPLCVYLFLPLSVNMPVSASFYHPLKVKAFLFLAVVFYVFLAVVFYVSLTFSRAVRRVVKTKKKVLNPANLNSRRASNVPITFRGKQSVAGS